MCAQKRDLEDEKGKIKKGKGMKQKASRMLSTGARAWLAGGDRRQQASACGIRPTACGTGFSCGESHPDPTFPIRFDYDVHVTGFLV